MVAVVVGLLVLALLPASLSLSPVVNTEWGPVAGSASEYGLSWKGLAGADRNLRALSDATECAKLYNRNHRISDRIAADPSAALCAMMLLLVLI